MVNSGVADKVAGFIIGMSHDYGPHVLLAVLFIITNLFTELITNNAAAALAFPLALSLSVQLGVDPTPFLWSFVWLHLLVFLHRSVIRQI